MQPKQDTKFARLLHDLRFTAVRRLPEVFRDVTADRLKYPTLARLVEKLEPSLWAEDPTRALLVVMRRAVAKLPEETAQDCAADRTWQHLGRLLYFGSEVNRSLQSYDDYVAAAIEYSGVPWAERTFGRNITRRVREKLATILFGMEQEGVRLSDQVEAQATAASAITHETSPNHTDVPKDRPDNADTQSKTRQDNRLPYVSPPIVPRDIPFVPRPTYASEFVARLANGHQIIPFVGEPGNGKSRLADWLIEQYRQPDESRINLRAHDRASLHTDIAVQLERHGISTLYMSGDQVLEQFALWLCAPDAPDIVFIDNLEDNDLFERLVLSDCRARVVVTSRENRVPTHLATPIVVHPMLPEEAQQIARYLLPEHENADMVRLAELLGSRPLPIVHASTGLLADGFMTVDQLHRAFERDAGSTMQQAKRPEDASLTLTWIYRNILERLHRLQEASTISVATLFELFAFVAPTSIPVRLLVDALKEYWTIENDADVSAIFQPAQRELCTRYLIMRDETKGEVTFSIHPFTQTLLRSILTKQGKELSICSCLHKPVQELLSTEQDDRNPLFAISISESALSWLPHIYAIACGLKGADDSAYRDMDFGHTVAILIRGFREVDAPILAQDATILHPAIAQIDQWKNTPYLHEAYIEHARLQYDLAKLTSPGYVLSLQQALLCLPDQPQAPGKKIAPRPMRMLEYIEAGFNNGNCADALDTVSLFENMYRTHIPDAVMIYKLVLMGEIFHQQCIWKQSRDTLDAARQFRAEVGFNDQRFNEWRFKREDMRALVTHVENGLMGGGGQEQTAHYEHIADALWAEKPEGITDSLTEGRYFYIKARCALTAWIRAQVTVIRDRVSVDADACNLLLDNGNTYIDKCNEAYAKTGSVRSSHLLFADVATVLFLLTRSGSPKLAKQYTDYVNEEYWKSFRYTPSRFSPRHVLAMEKLTLLSPSRSKRVHDVHGLEGLAETMGRGSESPYFYAEFLALTTAYDRLLRRPSTSKLATIKETYASIERADRFAALEAALACLPDDTDGFAREFIYLLLP